MPKCLKSWSQFQTENQALNKRTRRSASKPATCALATSGSGNSCLPNLAVKSRSPSKLRLRHSLTAMVPCLPIEPTPWSSLSPWLVTTSSWLAGDQASSKAQMAWPGATGRADRPWWPPAPRHRTSSLLTTRPI